MFLETPDWSGTEWVEIPATATAARVSTARQAHAPR
jgi:hypothetical protein